MPPARAARGTATLTARNPSRSGQRRRRRQPQRGRAGHRHRHAPHQTRRTGKAANGQRETHPTRPRRRERRRSDGRPEADHDHRAGECPRGRPETPTTGASGQGKPDQPTPPGRGQRRNQRTTGNHQRPRRNQRQNHGAPPTQHPENPPGTGATRPTARPQPHGGQNSAATQKGARPRRAQGCARPPSAGRIARAALRPASAARHNSSGAGVRGAEPPPAVGFSACACVARPDQGNPRWPR